MPPLSKRIPHHTTFYYFRYDWYKTLMPGFDEAWAAVALHRNEEPVSQGLRPLLQAVYSNCLAQPTNVVELKKSLNDLLTFLAGEGRTNANCWAVDLFFALSLGWDRDWADQDLPEDFHDLLALMGEALHDTVQAPDIARNFGCLPEQLLERLRHLPAVTPD